MDVTRSGYYTIICPDGLPLRKPDGSIRQVTTRDECYEYITSDDKEYDSEEGTYVISCPDRKVLRTDLSTHQIIPADDFPPRVISTPAPPAWTEGTPASYEMSQHIQDDGKSTLTYGLTGSFGAGITFNTATGLLSYDGSAGASNESHTLTIADAVGSDVSSSFSIIVEALDTAPTISTIPNISFTQGTGVQQDRDLSAYVTDDGESPVTYGLTGAVSTGVFFVQATGILSYDGFGALDSTTGHTFTATDAVDTTVSNTFDIEISDTSVADLDFAYRASGNGVVWWHNFVNAAEADAFRWTGGIGNDPNNGSATSDWCRHITSDYVSGGGCLELWRDAGSGEGGAWWRPMSPMDTGSGKSADDPAANGDLTVRTWAATQGGNQTATWGFGDYGPASTGLWEGDQFYIQIQLNIDQRRLDMGSSAGKIQYITRTEQSLTAQEINTYYKGSDTFALYRAGSPEIINELPPTLHAAGWHTYLYHIVPGDEVEGGNDTGSNTQVHVYRQDWVSGNPEYTKVFQKSDLGIDYQNIYEKAWNALLLTSYSNSANFPTEFSNRFDEVIFSRQPIPPKSTLSTSTLKTAAEALSAGQFSLDPIAQNPDGEQYDVSWQNTTGFWDDMRREYHYMGKAQTGGQARHWIYSEQSNLWRATGYDIAPLKLGHIWGLCFDHFNGDYYYIEQEPQEKGGAEDLTRSIRYMDRSVEAGAGTAKSPWTQLPNNPSQYPMNPGNYQSSPGYHPNLMGAGRPGVYVMGDWSHWYDINAGVWDNLGTEVYGDSFRGQSLYVPGHDILVFGAWPAQGRSLEMVVIRSGEMDDPTPDLRTVPITASGGTGNHGKLILDPRDDKVMMLLESRGNNVWTSSDEGQNWTLESYSHPFWTQGVALNWANDNATGDGGSWTPCSIPRHGAIISSYSNGSTNVHHTIMWRPG